MVDFGLTLIKDILDEKTKSKYIDQKVTVAGWTSTLRKQGGGLCFAVIYDGSTINKLQVVIETAKMSSEKSKEIKLLGVCAALKITGIIKEGRNGSIELLVNDEETSEIIIYGTSDQAKYPLAKKEHGKEFLRSIPHLRIRTVFMQSVALIRNELAFATHTYFRMLNFYYVHTPIITSTDCEGAGEMFTVTTLISENTKPEHMSVKEDGFIDYSKDFFKTSAKLTVSGQLALENYCMSLNRVYTFGPTFRAENSHTSRHLAEFWMIEAEVAFADLNVIMDLAEGYIKYCVEWVLNNCSDILKVLSPDCEINLQEELDKILKKQFKRLTYTEAIEILEGIDQTKFNQKVYWGCDLASEHERYLTEQHFNSPVIVTDYPYELKAFYMKANDDGKTVKAMDILLPQIGEIIGGSQREENLEKLDKQIKNKNIPVEAIEFYRDLRKFGTAPHSGFGLGFERLVMLCTGIKNIRDTIPFPRHPGTVYC